jgi:hypothetical protein
MTQWISKEARNPRGHRKEEKKIRRIQMIRILCWVTLNESLHD